MNLPKKLWVDFQFCQISVWATKILEYYFTGCENLQGDSALKIIIDSKYTAT